MPHRLGLPHETRMTPEPEESYLDKLRLGRRRRQWETETVGPSWRAMGRGFFSEEQRNSLLENERISRGLPVAYDIRIGASMEEINDALEEYLARTPDPESRVMEALGEAAQPVKETLDIVRGQTLLAIQNWIPGEQTAERIAREYEESGKGGRFAVPKSFFPITWADGGLVVAHPGRHRVERYDAAGAPVGSEFQVNSYTNNDQSHPSIAALPDGGFVVTWYSLYQDGSHTGIFGQRFDATGASFGSEFQANTYTTASQYYPSVAALSDGGFVATWVFLVA